MKTQLFFLLLFPILAFTACAQKPTATVTNPPPADSIPGHTTNDTSWKAAKEALIAKMDSAQITHFVIKVPEDQFGYSIFIDGQMYIEQKTIPAIQGNKGFATKEEADKIARLVIEKMREGEMPPSVTQEELTANGIKF